RRPAKAWIAAAAAIAVAAAWIGVSEMLSGGRTPHPAPSHSPVIGFPQGPTQGLATNAVKLVGYGTPAAAPAPAVVPSPHERMYRALLQKSGRRRNREGTWWEGNWRHMFARWPNGKVIPAGSSTGRCPGQLNGWPGCINNVYRYLATLPADPAALRHVILAN